MKKIYILCDPREVDPVLRVKYVGASRDPVLRLKGHIASPGKRTISPGHRTWIANLLSAGLLPVLEVLTDPQGSEADVIRRYRLAGAPLTNISDGIQDWKPESDTDKTRRREVAMQIAARLTTVRRAKGLSLDAVGLMVNVSRQRIFDIERAAALPRVDTLYELAMAIGCSPTWLAFGDER